MSAFDQLHPALQHHIVNTLGWASLRSVQELAIGPTLAGENLIVLAPTAGGKTEAAFFPLLSLMLGASWGGLSVVYVSPIKALLNNQEERLRRYFGLVGRRSALWHGDVPAMDKRRLTADPPDCLLTTPESLEVMLISGNIHHERLFANLRALVVDEVHAFAGDDRGWHLLAIVQRLGRLAGRDIQRIGLSATVGNPEGLVRWISAGSSRPGRVIRPEPENQAAPQVELDYVGGLDNAAKVIASLHAGEKRLVFCDSRSRVEQLAAALRTRGTDAFVSHSSLSLDERRRAEQAFAEGRNCVIVATSALELGIDVGDLDRVIQIDAPATVSSFLQRMGRTGRRPGSQRNCLFLATTDEGLLRAAGLVALWSSGYVEGVFPPHNPAHILVQQLMALALQERGIGRSEWFSWLDAVPAFQEICVNEREQAVAWMLDQHILFEEAGVLSLGEKGEHAYGRRNFLELFSVFTAPPEFTVRYGERELGSVHEATFLARRAAGPVPLLLAGRSWNITHIDWRRRLAYVEPLEAGGRSVWRGGGQTLSFALCRAIREVLTADTPSPSWSRRTCQTVADLRSEYPWLKPDDTCVVFGEKGEVNWWTFAGGRANASFAAWMSPRLGCQGYGDNFAVRLPHNNVNELERVFRELASVDPEQVLPTANEEAIEGLKFSECLPVSLAVVAVQRRLTDTDAVRRVLTVPVRFVFGTAEPS